MQWKRRMLVPPYHSASNGAAEHSVQTVKNNPKKSGSGRFWVARLVFHYRTILHEATGRAPCELLMRKMFKTSLNVLWPSLQSSVLFKPLKQDLYTERRYRKSFPLNPEKDVFPRNFRQGSTCVSARVVGVVSRSSSQVRLEDGTLYHRHGDRFRPRESQAAARGEDVTPQVEHASAAAQLRPLPPQPLPPVCLLLNHPVFPVFILLPCHLKKPWVTVRVVLPQTAAHRSCGGVHQLYDP